MTIYIIIGSVVLFLIIASTIRHKQAHNKVVCVNEENCTGCQRCVKRCRRGALNIADKKIMLDSTKCTACGDCVAVCKFKALEIINRKSIR